MKSGRNCEDADLDLVDVGSEKGEAVCMGGWEQKEKARQYGVLLELS